MWFRVVAVNEAYRPIAGVVIEAIDLTDRTITASETTNRAGEVLISDLTGPHFFRPRVRRTSGNVGGRPYTGAIQIQVVGFSTNCMDYIVDSDGGGTHLTLALAVADAITNGGDITIWMCQSETVSASIDIGGLGSNDIITVTSVSQKTTVLTAANNVDIFTQDSNGGQTTGGLVFRELGFDFGTGDVAILDVNADAEIKNLKFYNCDFLSGSGNSYLVRQDSTVSMGSLQLEVVNCTGQLEGFYKVGGSSSTYAPDRLIATDNILTLTEWWDGGSSFACSDSTLITGGYYAITTTLDLQSALDELHFSDLYIRAAMAGPLFDSASGNSDMDHISFTALTVRFSNSSGVFCDLDQTGGNSSGLFLDGIFGYAPTGTNPTGTFVTIDSAWGDIHVGDIYGARWSPQYSGPDSSGYGSSHAILDGVMHTDSVADGVTQGSLIVGNATPKWDELVVGSNKAYLRSDGTDPAWSTIPADEVLLPVLGSPTYTHVEHINTLFHSSGWFSGGVITDAGSANINVSAGTGAMRASDSTVAQLLFFDWASASSQAITANSIRYVGVEYNFGTPQVVIRTTDNFDDTTAFLLGTVVNEGGTLHIQNAPWKIGDHASAMIQRSRGTAPIARDKVVGGLIFSEAGTRNVVVSAGALWHGLTSFTIGAIDTNPGGAADTFTTYSAGGQEDTGVAAWPNGQYDSSGTLTNLDGNRWANLWWYLELDGELVMVYGTAQYTSAAKAGEEAAPSTLPNRLQVHGVLAARFIFQKSAGTAEEILSAFDTPFAVLGVTDHGNLAGLGDDDHTQYTLHSILTTTGDIFIASSGGVAGRLAVGSANQILGVSGGKPAWQSQSYIDHGALTGRSDDDHTQYALLAGRSGGQTLIGGTANNNDLILQSTSGGTKGNVEISNTRKFLAVSLGSEISFSVTGGGAMTIDAITAPVKFPVAGSGGGILIGGDVQLYRSAANVLSLGNGDWLSLSNGGLVVGIDNEAAIILDGGNWTPVDVMGIGESGGSLFLQGRNGMYFVVDPAAGGARNFYWYANDDLATGTKLMQLGEDGQLQLPVTGSGAGILIGGDTQLYRSSPNLLVTPDSFVIQGTLFVDIISEITGGAGVTIDSVLLKDGLVDGIDVADHGITAHTGHAADKFLYTDNSGDEQEVALGAAGGLIEMKGTTSAPVVTVPKRTIDLMMAGGAPTTTAGASATTQAEGAGNQNNYWYADFATGADDHVFWTMVMPDNWDGGTVTFKAYWSTTATDTDGVAWALRARSYGDNEAIDQAFGTAVVVTDDAQSAAATVLITAASGALTIGGTPAAGEYVIWDAFRDVSDGNDDMTENARLLGIKVEYGVNAVSDAG